MPLLGLFLVSTGRPKLECPNSFAPYCNQFQHIELGLTARKQALVDNIDAWAMWISPPVFLIFNAVYWVSFRHVGAELFTFS